MAKARANLIQQQESLMYKSSLPVHPNEIPSKVECAPNNHGFGFHPSICAYTYLITQKEKS